jgi:LemA protein
MALSTSMKIGIAALVVIVILVGMIAGMYNNFVGLDQNVQGKWSEVENQYTRQAELIPNLASVVSSAYNSESKFVKDVIDARTRWQSAASQLAKDQAGIEMNNGVTALVNAVAENYPTLQANKQFSAISDELIGTQNRITVARGRFIEAIQGFNTAIKMFPGNVFAGMFGFIEKSYYQAAEASMITPSLGSGTLPA